MGDCDRALEVPSIRALASVTVHALRSVLSFATSKCGERFSAKTARIGTESVNCGRCQRILDRPAK